MAKIEANLADVKTIGALPKDIYRAIIHEVITEENGQALKSKAGNSKFRLTWRILDGEYADRKIPYDEIVYSGKGKDGGPLVPFQFAKLIEATSVARECLHCHSTSTERFVRGTGDNGIEKGRIVCPECRQPMQVRIDTDNLLGARARIALDVTKREGSDREYNEVKDYMPLEALA